MPIPLLAGKDEIAEIALAKQRKIFIKFQLIAQDVHILRAKQSQSLLTNVVDVSIIIGRIAHRHNDIYRVAKLLMYRLQRSNMLIAAIARVTHRIVSLPSRGVSFAMLFSAGFMRVGK